MAWGPEPFTGTQNYSDPDGVIATINAAMQAGHRLILAMTGGPAEIYTTEGKFDFGKWKRRLDRFNTPEVKQAVANGVAYGTIIGYQIIDEPETRRWGGNITKATIDEMASYAKSMFPTLPMGLNHGPPGYVWRVSEQYKVLDYVLYQYNYFVTAGDVVAWRDATLAQARRDGVTPMFALNILDGGVQDRSRNYSCKGAGQAGIGTYQPNCRMTAKQIRDWAAILGTAGCAFQMWRYDADFISQPANQEVFKEIAEKLRNAPARSCARP